MTINIISPVAYSLLVLHLPSYILDRTHYTRFNIGFKAVHVRSCICKNTCAARVRINSELGNQSRDPGPVKQYDTFGLLEITTPSSGIVPPRLRRS